MKSIIATGILFLFLVPCALAADEISYDREFVGIEWSVTGFFNGEEDLSVLDRYPISLTLTPGGWIYGTTGCKHFSGSYRLEEDTQSLHIDSVRRTQTACPGEVEYQEDIFREILPRAMSYQYDGETFTFHDADERAFVTLVPKNLPVNEAIWSLVAYGTEQNTPHSSVIPTIVFSDDRAFTGTSGCSPFFGEFYKRNNELRIEWVENTPMECVDEETRILEEEYFALLRSVVTYVIENDFLVLYNERHEDILRFEAVPALNLYNIPFELRSFDVDGEERDVRDDARIMFRVEEDNIIAGDLGCNTYSATANFDESDPARITVSSLIPTAEFCDDEGIMEQQSLYLATFETAYSFDFDGMNLKFYNEGGDTIATFVVTEI